MFSAATEQHRWYDDFVGEWEFTHTCDAGPENGGVNKSSGKLSARSLGGLWLQMECTGEMPDGSGGWTSIFSLGYSIPKKKFVGTFVASMMDHLWIYEGDLDVTGKVLTLNVEGPKFSGDGMTMYQDIIEKRDPNFWILRSRMQQDDGRWVEFMLGEHRRVH